MRERCSNPKHISYPYYGARGIKVCERWESFDNFYADMGLPPEPGMSIDRIDGTKDYCTDNCRWARRVEQNSNRPGFNRIYVVNGQEMTMKQAWAYRADLRLSYTGFRKRLIELDWPLNLALNLPHGSRLQDAA